MRGRLQRTTRGLTQQDLRVGDDSPGDGDSLLLPTTEEHTSLSDVGVVAVGQGGYEAVGVGFDRGGSDELHLGLLWRVFEGRSDEAVHDVLEDGRLEEDRLLRYETCSCEEGGQWICARFEGKRSEDEPICCRSHLTFKVLMSRPSSRTAPAVGS